MAAKSKRSVNWSEDEKKYLLGLIGAKIDIIECKKVDANANKRKTSAWKTVYEGYISKYGNFRSISQIKDQWHRMKLSAKKDISRFNREQRQTGGGPAPSTPKELSMQIQSLIPNDFESLTNPFDDDFPVPGKNNDDKW